MDKLGAAIIGCGSIYKVHADAIVGSADARLVAVADIEEQKAKAAASQYACAFYTDYKEMLGSEKIDVVHICTPHYLHAPMAIEALKNGKHVLVEKPMAINEEQAQRMAAEAEKSGRYLGVAFQNRYNNTSLNAKAILDEGTLGPIKGIKGFVTWYREASYYTQSSWRGKFKTEGGGVLINQAIHTLDLMQWLAGDIKAIKGHVDTRVLEHVIEVEDTADATIYFKNGAVGLFYATNCFTTNAAIEIEVHCEKGILKINDDELVLVRDGAKERIASDQGDSPYKTYWGNSHNKLIGQFYRCILEENETDYITGEEGITALKMIKGIYQSSSEHAKVFI